MVYDCFAFFNELDLLEIRLNELNGVVDKFVIVEATRTFQKNPKPLYYFENKERYRQFSDKIIHVVVDHYPTFFSKFRIPTAWDYDNHQKEQIWKGIKTCAPNDVIIISDIDEIPNPKKIEEFKNTKQIKVFEQKFYYYFLNCLAMKAGEENMPDYWRGPVMLLKKQISTIRKTRNLRGKTGKDITIVKDGGWHYSYMGGVEKIIKKIEALSHVEFNEEYYKDPKRIEEIINSGKDLFDRDIKFKITNIDESSPEYLRCHPEKFIHLIKKMI